MLRVRTISPAKNKKDYHCERIINVFSKYVTDKGGQILLQTPGTDLIMDNGKVVGVWAKDKSGEKIRINAKAVLLLPAVSPATRR